jgi:predicted acetyltransferase
MDDITIRSIEPDELEAFLQVVERAFHGRWIPEDAEPDRIIAEPDRWFVATDGDEIVGTAGACTTRLTVPGGSLPAPGVTAVGVLPSHRRRGINTRMMAAILNQAAERGEPLVYLWASETPIYGRFGYGMASLCTLIEMAADRSAFVPGVRIGGRVRVLPRDEALPLMRPVYDEVASTRPGMIAVDDRWWKALWIERKRDEEHPNFYAVHERDDGTVDGYAVYRVKHEWTRNVPANELTVRDLITTDADAAAALWRFLFDVDLVATVKADDRPIDEELLWLVAEPRRLNAVIQDGLFVRVLDVERALSGRRYSGDGRLVLEIDDAFRPATSGRYELIVEAGAGSCERRADAEPDLSCGVTALGAAYLGGSSFRQLGRAHQVEERTPGALARADAMFTWDPSPWFAFVY